MAYPAISIVVPVYNDPDGIRATLESLLAQSTGREYRVVVVDNDSTDRTPEVVRSYDDARLSLCHETATIIIRDSPSNSTSSPPLRPHALSVRPTKRLRTPLSERRPTGPTTARGRDHRPGKGLYVDSANRYLWERSIFRRASTRR